MPASGLHFSAPAILKPFEKQWFAHSVAVSPDPHVPRERVLVRVPSLAVRSVKHPWKCQVSEPPLLSLTEIGFGWYVEPGPAAEAALDGPPTTAVFVFDAPLLKPPLLPAGMDGMDAAEFTAAYTGPDAPELMGLGFEDEFPGFPLTVPGA